MSTTASSTQGQQASTMTGRVIIVTGANSGLGFEAAKYLCDGGNEVILACRNEERGKAAVGKILKDNPNALASFMQLDLSDLSSVRQFVDEFHKSDRKLHVLINNAGIFLNSKDRKRYFTKENFELNMGTNHLGHFLLTNLLLDDLKKTGSESGDSRVVVVSSMLHDGNARKEHLPALDVDDLFLGEAGKYSANLAYKNSKLANILFAYELAKRLEGSGVTVNALCPGFIPSTELVRHASAPMRFLTRYILHGILRFTKITRTVEQGSKAIVELAVGENVKGVSGKYYRDNAEAESSEESKNEELRQKVWELSARYCHLEGYEPLDAPPPPVEEPKQAEAATGKDKEKTEEPKAEAAEAAVEVKVEGAEGQTEVKVETVGGAGDAGKEEKTDEAQTEEKKDETKEETTAQEVADSKIEDLKTAEIEKKGEEIVAPDTAVPAQ